MTLLIPVEEPRVYSILLNSYIPIVVSWTGVGRLITVSIKVYYHNAISLIVDASAFSPRKRTQIISLRDVIVYSA
jgi:hypothetical protein